MFLTITPAAFLVYVWQFYLFYVAYTAIHRLKKDVDRWNKLPKLVRGFFWSYLLPGLAMDFVFNWLFGPFIFLEAPWGHGLLFTARCQQHRQETGWRKKVADWFCDGWLNPLEPGHC